MKDRTCSECKTTKPIDEFPKAKYAGQRARCNWCTVGYLRRFREANKRKREESNADG